MPPTPIKIIKWKKKINTNRASSRYCHRNPPVIDCGAAGRSLELPIYPGRQYTNARAKLNYCIAIRIEISRHRFADDLKRFGQCLVDSTSAWFGENYSVAFIALLICIIIAISVVSWCARNTLVWRRIRWFERTFILFKNWTTKKQKTIWRKPAESHVTCVFILYFFGVDPLWLDHRPQTVLFKQKNK